jgi:hypothetical protein
MAEKVIFSRRTGAKTAILNLACRDKPVWGPGFFSNAGISADDTPFELP